MLQLDEPIDVYHCWIDECEERMLEAASSPAPLAPDHRSQRDDDRGRLIPPGMGQQQHQQQPLSPIRRPQQSQQRLSPSPRQQQQQQQQQRLPHSLRQQQQQHLSPGPRLQQQQHLSPDIRDVAPAATTRCSRESSGPHPQPSLAPHPAGKHTVMQCSSPVAVHKAEQLQSHESGSAADAAAAAGQGMEEGAKIKRKRLILKIPAKLAA